VFFTFIFEGKLTPPSQVMATVYLSMEGFSQAMNIEDKTIRALVRPPPLWTKRPLGVWKIKWDAAISKEMDRMGVGVIIRDAAGLVMATRTKVILYITNPAAAEALDAWEAVVLAQEVGGSRILLEGDSPVIVSALGTRESSLRVYDQILDDIKSQLSLFSSVEVKHVRRNAIRMAHICIG
jgi:PII-like signaling protein